MSGAADLVEAKALRKYFPIRKGLMGRITAHLKAVDGVDFAVRRGEVLGLVGESGSGKSTVGRLVLRLIEPSAGEIRFDGIGLTHLSQPKLRRMRRRMQMIFQDPYSSLNPRMTVGEAIADALRTHGLARGHAAQERTAILLRKVGLRPDHMRRYPRAFSGGQRQRIAIARALAVEPDFLVADEPVSALDVSIQADIVTLLDDLRRQLGLAMLFISHDLSVVETLADRVVVLYLGRVMETGPTRAVFAAPRHPYTRALLSAVPGRDRELELRRFAIEGEVPSPISPPSGCVFRTRCPFALPACAQAPPMLRQVGPDRATSCIRDDLDLS